MSDGIHGDGFEEPRCSDSLAAPCYAWMKKLSHSIFTVNSVDDRGWYICFGYHYLQHDGDVNHGVNGEAGGFWPTQKEAELFLSNWLEA